MKLNKTVPLSFRSSTSILYSNKAGVCSSSKVRFLWNITSIPDAATITGIKSSDLQNTSVILTQTDILHYIFKVVKFKMKLPDSWVNRVCKFTEKLKGH